MIQVEVFWVVMTCYGRITAF